MNEESKKHLLKMIAELPPEIRESISIRMGENIAAKMKQLDAFTEDPHERAAYIVIDLDVPDAPEFRSENEIYGMISSEDDVATSFEFGKFIANKKTRTFYWPEQNYLVARLDEELVRNISGAINKKGTVQ